MPTKADIDAILEAARTLERFGFSNKDAEQASGAIAKNEMDLANLANLLEYRHGVKPDEAKQYAREMLDRGPTGDRLPQGWDMYVRPEVVEAEGGKPQLEDPLINYVTSKEYMGVPDKMRQVQAGYAAMTNPPTATTGGVYMQNPRSSSESAKPAGNPYDDRLAKAASLRKTILGY